jgi:hypothetical protein
MRLALLASPPKESDMELTVWIFKYIGGTVCVLSGIAVTALAVGWVTGYAWEKMTAAHRIVVIQRAVKAYKKTGSE